METLKIPLSDLKPPKRNVRLHPEVQIREFVRSLKMFGQIRPIVVDENNTVLIGNGQVMALKQMGATEAEAIRLTNLTEKQKTKLMIADNQIFHLGLFDHQAVIDLLRDLGDDHDVPGYDEELLDQLLAETSQVDEIIESEGLLSSDEIAECDEERADQEERIAAKNSEADQVATEDKRYVICPHCGGKVWL